MGEGAGGMEVEGGLIGQGFGSVGGAGPDLVRGEARDPVGTLREEETAGIEQQVQEQEQRLNVVQAREDLRGVPEALSPQTVAEPIVVASEPDVAESNVVEPGVGEAVAAEPQRLGVLGRTVAFIKELWSEKIHSKK